MGLLDQVLGQVIGRMGGGTSGAQQPGGFPQGGFPQGGGFGAPGGSGMPGGAGLPGGLGQILNGNGGKIALAILALLASKHLSSGAGGYGSVLHDMFAGNRSGGDPAQAPSSGGMFDPGSAPQSSGSSSGGFMNEIGGMLGGGQPAADSGFGSVSGGSSSSGLGGMLGGGLGELLNRFSQNGRGDLMQSWIGTGPNQSVSPQELETSLGPDTVDSLSRETGLDRGDLLSQLSQALPQVVDKLTPNGRLPDSHESSTWV